MSDSTPTSAPLALPTSAPRNIPVSVETTPPILPVAQTNPVCHVCGGDPNATATNPDLIIVFPDEINAPVPQATCGQIYQSGLDNGITVEQCAIVLLDVETQTLCGCSNIDAQIPTPKPILSPTSSPSKAPVPVEASLETNPPDTVIPTLVDVDAEESNTCERKGEFRIGGKGKTGMMMGKLCKKQKSQKAQIMDGKGMGKGKGGHLRV